MSDEQRLRTVRKMINAGMYDEARAALHTIDHPMADKWLQKLNQISPPTHKVAPRKQSASRKKQSKEKPKSKSKTQEIDDFYADAPDAESSSNASKIVVVAVLAAIGVLLIGGALMLTQGGDFVEPAITTDNTGCGGQEWVNSIDGAFNELYRYNLWDMFTPNEYGFLLVDEELRDTQINDLKTRLTRIEKSVAPDCMVAVRDTLIEAYESQIRATEIFNDQDPINAFGLFGKTLRLMKEAATEMVEMGAQFRRVDSAAINQLVDPECPAFEYVTRAMYVDNQFLVLAFVDPQVQTLEAYYSLRNDFAQQYYRVIDDPNVPPCLWEVRNQLAETIDGVKSLLDAALGSDLNGMYHHADRVQVAWAQLAVEMEKVGLDPLQFGGDVQWILMDE